MKRIFDIVFAFIGLLVLMPLFIVIGSIIRLNSKGPIIFKQKRVGQHGKKFILLKFRSMTMLKSAEDGIFEPGNTSRITTVGKFLRKTKIDELPQLINVLCGKMSIVGPRPEIEKWVSVYPERWRRVLVLKPGITDNSSVLFRNEEYMLRRSADPDLFYKDIILPKKLDIYENYVSNHSFLGDICIIIKTLRMILPNKS